jgi:hypothetical protein
MYNWLNVLCAVHSEYKDGKVQLVPVDVAAAKLAAAQEDIYSRIMYATSEEAIQLEASTGFDISHARAPTAADIAAAAVGTTTARAGATVAAATAAGAATATATPAATATATAATAAAATTAGTATATAGAATATAATATAATTAGTAVTATATPDASTATATATDDDVMLVDDDVILVDDDGGDVECSERYCTSCRHRIRVPEEASSSSTIFCSCQIPGVRAASTGTTSAPAAARTTTTTAAAPETLSCVLVPIIRLVAGLPAADFPVAPVRQAFEAEIAGFFDTLVAELRRVWSVKNAVGMPIYDASWVHLRSSGNGYIAADLQEILVGFRAGHVQSKINEGISAQFQGAAHKVRLRVQHDADAPCSPERIVAERPPPVRSVY